MAKQLKYTIVLFLSFMNTVMLIGQTTISYSYDTAGNRIGRSITVSPVKQRDDKVTKLEQSTIDDLQECVLVTADSKAGTVIVTIPTWKDGDNCTISVYNTGGSNICSLAATDATTTIDLSTSPTGTYILRTTLNGKTSTWKIAIR